MLKETAPQDTRSDKPKHSNLFLRVASAAVMIPVLLAILLLGNATAWAVCALIIGILAAWEYMRITCGEEPLRVRAVSVVTAFIPAITAYLVAGSNAPLYTDYSWIILGSSAAVAMWIAFLSNLMRNRDISRASGVINATIGCALYVALSVLFLALYKRDLYDLGNPWLLTLMAMTWGSDTGAYFAGRRYGRHKLAPVLSPKKTIEGAAGGLAAALAAAFIARATALDFLSIPQTILLAVVANFLAQTGDLAESLIKRSHGVKDSGSIIPGHGGVLDRIDALIFSAPFVYIFAMLTLPWAF